jgi:hypothetical protein
LDLPFIEKERLLKSDRELMLLSKKPLDIAFILALLFSAVVMLPYIDLASAIPFAAASSLFYRTYGEVGEAYDVVQTGDGGYALAGYNLEQGSNVFCLVKTDDAGTIPEFPSFLVLPLFMIATLITIATAASIRKKAPKNTSCESNTAR